MVLRPLLALGRPLLALGLVALLAACVSPPDGTSRTGARGGSGDGETAQLVAFGEPFHTTEGQVFVLRIQDEFRVIRCIPDGPIAGCYEDVLSVPGHDVPWNVWLEVGDVPGLQVSFVSPTAIALYQRPPEEPVELPQAK